MKWVKKGLTFKPEGQREWATTHAMLPVADHISGDQYQCVRPGLGLLPKYYDVLLGRRVNSDVKMGTPTDWKYVG